MKGASRFWWRWGWVPACAAVAPLLLACSAEKPPEDPRPNIVIIYADDLDFHELGVTGGRVLTPNIDRLANGGMRFDRAYVTSPICTPSRYSLLTGRFAGRSPALMASGARVGSRDHRDPVRIEWNTYLEAGETSIARVLRDNGYATGMVGKWHLGIDDEAAEGSLPLPPQGTLKQVEVSERLRDADRRIRDNVASSSGFDYVASLCAKNLGAMTKSWGLPQALAVHNVDWVTHGAVEFIEQQQAGPFFLYLATTVPHAPRHGPTEADVHATPAGWLSEAPSVQPSRESVGQRVEAAGFEVRTEWMTWLDDGVGAVLDKLDDVGVADRAVVILMSDHGSRGKYTLHEDGARVPCFVRWPGHVEPGSSSEAIVANIDIAPTVFEIAGVEPSGRMTLDGQSWVPLLTGARTEWRENLLLEVAFARGIVSRDWKFIAVRFPFGTQAFNDREGPGRIGWEGTERIRFGAARDFPGYFDGDQLYNLRSDPDEQNHLAGDSDHAAKLEQMRNLLREGSSAHPHPFAEFNSSN